MTSCRQYPHAEQACIAKGSALQPEKNSMQPEKNSMQRASLAILMHTRLSDQSLAVVYGHFLIQCMTHSESWLK